MRKFSISLLLAKVGGWVERCFVAPEKEVGQRFTDLKCSPHGRSARVENVGRSISSRAVNSNCLWQFYLCSLGSRHRGCGFI